MDATKKEWAALPLGSEAEEEEVTPFIKTFDMWSEDGKWAARRAIGEWGRAHSVRSFDPRSGVLTVNFRLHPDDRWRSWERARKAKILAEDLK